MDRITDPPSEEGTCIQRQTRKAEKCAAQLMSHQIIY